jgi:hypothetical protein
LIICKEFKMMLQIAKYELKLIAGQLNAASPTQTVQGFLLRLVSEIGWGVACVQPWPTLGDGSLQEHLLDLKLSSPKLPLNQRAIEWALLDAKARSSKISLAPAEFSVTSHRTLALDTELTESYLKRLKNQGWKVLKAKQSPDKIISSSALDKIAKYGFKIRLDFNNSMKMKPFMAWWNGLSEMNRRTIEFVEDPFLFNSEDWSNFGEKVAWDFQQGKFIEGDWTLVYKPTRESLMRKTNKSPIVITTSMDHPVGQRQALAEIYRLSSSSHPEIQWTTHGLSSHLLFHETKYSHLLSSGFEFKGWSEFGLGFEELLNSESWEPVK